MEVVQGISGHSIEHVSLLASGGWAWSSWHMDSNPGGIVVASQRGEGSCVVVIKAAGPARVNTQCGLKGVEQDHIAWLLDAIH